MYYPKMADTDKFVEFMLKKAQKKEEPQAKSLADSVDIKEVEDLTSQIQKKLQRR